MSVAVITGGGGGIGRGIAQALMVDENRIDDVILTDIDEHALSAAVSRLSSCDSSVSVHAVRNDVSSSRDVAEVANQVVSNFGAISVLINNAAVTDRSGRVEQISDDDWDSEIAVNLSSAFYWIRAVFTSMREAQWGRIVNISSVAGTMGNYGHAPYSASKAGLIGLTKTVALEGAKSGVTVNAIAPGIIRTPAYDRIQDGLRVRTEATAAMKRAGEVDEVASLVSYLVSDRASYITGAVVPVAGGTDLFVM